MNQTFRLLRATGLLLAVGATAACGDDDVSVDASVSMDASAADAGAADAGATDAGVTDAGETDSGSDAGPVSAECEAIAANFVSLGAANADLADPELSAACEGDEVVVNSNSIPDFPYVETSPGVPRAEDVEYRFPSNPEVAAETSEVPLLGALGVAINGIPIFGQAEGTGGDVLSLGDGFTECGGHNGPSGYHYHTFDVTGSDDCRFTEEDAAAGVLYGYAFDGFPIYGNNEYASSYELTDESLFASDTWSAHTYIEGSGDLDECNGRTDEDGNYAYYTTESFPYTVGCFRGTPTENGGGGGMMMGGGGMMP